MSETREEARKRKLAQPSTVDPFKKDDADKAEAKAKAKRKGPQPKPRAKAKHEGSTFRDHRGPDGVLEDAQRTLQERDMP
jgi:hypothetical protein